MTARPGAVSLAELLLVLALFSLVLGGLGEFVTSQARLAARQTADLRLMEATRTAQIVLGAELRALDPADIGASSRDSLRIRAFRGGGDICVSDDLHLGVRYRGVRLPDPHKDSVLLVGPDAEEARGITGVGGKVCDGEGLLLLLDAPPSAGAGLALVYESGAYHLADGALRYRRGRGGRQPLVEAILDQPAFELAPGAPVRLRITARRDSLPHARRTFVVSAPKLNAGPP